MALTVALMQLVGHQTAISLITKISTTMKKILFLLLFVGVAGLTAQAQSCHGTKKASSETKAKAEATVVSQDQSPEVLAAAEKAAEADENIEKRVCQKSGKVSFVRKSVCEKSGTVSYKSVVFDAEKGAFVDASKGSCSAKEKAACSKKAADKKSCDKKGDKASCCSKGAKSGKACCSKKAKADKKS